MRGNEIAYLLQFASIGGCWFCLGALGVLRSSLQPPPALLAAGGDFSGWETPASLAKSSAGIFRFASILTTVTPSTRSRSLPG
jgi:hypothetical protein